MLAQEAESKCCGGMDENRIISRAKRYLAFLYAGEDGKPDLKGKAPTS
jgi:hypothetical protein